MTVLVASSLATFFLGDIAPQKTLIAKAKQIRIALEHKQAVGIKKCSGTKCFIQTRQFHLGAKEIL